MFLKRSQQKNKSKGLCKAAQKQLSASPKKSEKSDLYYINQLVEFDHSTDTAETST